MQLASKDVAAFAGVSKGAETYGELLPEAVMDMLWTIGAQPGDRFYDLGAGAGKVVAQAWMSGLRATGIELSRARWEASCQAVHALESIVARRKHIFSKVASAELPQQVADGLDFLCANAFDIDFTDADVIFVSSVMFSDQMMAKLAAIARWMKPGSLIVSYDSFPGPEFREIGDFMGATSWFDGTLWRVQEVVKNPAYEDRPSDLRRSHEIPEACRCSFRQI
jgi:SAM-dependent methyltransferase